MGGGKMGALGYGEGVYGIGDDGKKRKGKPTFSTSKYISDNLGGL